MQGIIFDIKKFAVHDGTGIRTTVFMQGCPLRCNWCHNPESIRCISNGNLTADSNDKLPGNIQKFSARELLNEIEKDRIFYEESGGGVTFSGGEPLLQSEFLREILEYCKTTCINTAVDTSGYSEYSDFEKIIPFTGLFLFDLKIADAELHKKYTGVSNDIIIDNFRQLTETGVPLRVRIPLIPGITDTAENIEGITDIIKSAGIVQGVDLLPYNIFAAAKQNKINSGSSMKKTDSQNKKELAGIEQIFNAGGLDVNFGG